MDKWFKYLKEARDGVPRFGRTIKTSNSNSPRSSAAGIKHSVKALTGYGDNEGGNPTGMKKVKDPLEDKDDEKDISAPPGAPGGGSVGNPGPAALEEYEVVDAESFEMNSTLHPLFWRQFTLNPKISKRLVEIAEDFLENLEIDVEMEDLRLTGSLANFNWSKYSDVDLHIVVNFSELDEDIALVKAYFDAARARWNDTHDIKIKGQEVEIYVENSGEDHVSSGLYSVSDGKWITKPSFRQVDLDIATARKKSDDLQTRINLIGYQVDAKKYQSALRTIDRVKSKIRKMRRAGLSGPQGEFSPENIAFKILRREGSLGVLNDLKNQAYDAMMSVNERIIDDI